LNFFCCSRNLSKHKAPICCRNLKATYKGANKQGRKEGSKQASKQARKEEHVLCTCKVKPGSCSVQGLLYEGHAILPQEKSKADLLSPAVAAAMLHIILFFQQQLQKKQKILIGCPTAHL
jgi:hypothetical protein